MLGNTKTCCLRYGTRHPGLFVMTVETDLLNLASGSTLGRNLPVLIILESKETIQE